VSKSLSTRASHLRGDDSGFETSPVAGGWGLKVASPRSCQPRPPRASVSASVQWGRPSVSRPEGPMPQYRPPAWPPGTGLGPWRLASRPSPLPGQDAARHRQSWAGTTQPRRPLKGKMASGTCPRREPGPAHLRKGRSKASLRGAGKVRNGNLHAEPGATCPRPCAGAPRPGAAPGRRPGSLRLERVFEWPRARSLGWPGHHQPWVGQSGVIFPVGPSPLDADRFVNR
jgi:hypothetical protein